MNKHVRLRSKAERKTTSLPTTQGAEGLPRLAWDRARIEAAVTAGVFQESDRFELIDGEIVPMSPKGIRHEQLKRALLQHWVRACPPSVEIMTETTLWVSETQFIEPDFLFLPSSLATADLAAEKCFLAVEIAASSFNYDFNRKREIYAASGLPAYWVVDANELDTYVFAIDEHGRYGEPETLTPEMMLQPTFAPDMALSLGALDIK